MFCKVIIFKVLFLYLSKNLEVIKNDVFDFSFLANIINIIHGIIDPKKDNNNADAGV